MIFILLSEKKQQKKAQKQTNCPLSVFLVAMQLSDGKMIMLQNKYNITALKREAGTKVLIVQICKWMEANLFGLSVHPSVLLFMSNIAAIDQFKI